jgi:alkylhydroperoxidase family enzyme
MLRWLIGRRIAAFEREYDYDMGYARDILAAGVTAFRRFAPALKMTDHNDGVPRDAFAAAKLAATLAEDCGPCVQLVSDLAAQEGVSPAVLRAVLTGDLAAMGDEAALAYRFAQAVLARDIEAETHRAEIERRWGKRAVVSLALAIAGSRIYPTLKYALGHGQACARVRVGDMETEVRYPT